MNRAVIVHADKVRSAREDLISAGLLHVADTSRSWLPAEIDRSWRRSIGAGASAEPGAFRYVNDVDPDSEFHRAARPVLDSLQDSLRDMGVAVFLSDTRGQIIARRATDSCDLARFDRACAAEGFDFSEESIGTNGLGTAMLEEEAVFVQGAEHFNVALEGLACAGMGIRHPVTGRALGSLSLSCAADAADPLMLAMTREAVQEIVRNLGEYVGRRDRVLSLHYQQHRGNGPIVVLNRDTVLTNVAGLSFLCPDRHARLWEILLEQDWTNGPHRLDLGVAGLHGPVLAHRIDNDADDPAFAVEISITRERGAGRGGGGGRGHRSVPSRRASTAPQDCTSARRLVQEQLDKIAHYAGVPVLVTGPSGSGKLRAVTCWLSSRGLGDPLVLDAVVFGDSAEWLGQARAAIGAATPVVLRHAEDLHPSQLSRVKAIDGQLQVTTKAAAVCLPGLIITADPQRCADTTLELLRQVATEVEVPPLASRREDIAPLIEAIAAEIDPSMRPVLSAAAMQAMMRWRWPGNIAELSRTLHALANDRPGHVVGPEHLPEHLRAAVRRRVLTRIESAERAEIVAALRQARGNRSQAADLVGIGRTTLYRKLRSLGIDTPEELATWPVAAGSCEAAGRRG